MPETAKLASGKLATYPRPERSNRIVIARQRALLLFLALLELRQLPLNKLKQLYHPLRWYCQLNNWLRTHAILLHIRQLCRCRRSIKGRVDATKSKIKFGVRVLYQKHVAERDWHIFRLVPNNLQFD